MARTPLDEAADLTAADVVHKRFSALPADVTVARVRDWFAVSSHRRMAFLADNGVYAGSLSRDDLKGELEPARPAAELASPGPAIAPDASAHTAFELAVATRAHRVPVVDPDGNLIGVVGVTDDLTAFCGTN